MNQRKYHHKKIVATGHFKRRKLWLFPTVLIVFLLLFHFFGVAYAQAPVFREMIGKVVEAVQPKLKPITQSSKILSVNTQQAIQTVAEQEIQAEQVQALIPTNTPDGSVASAILTGNTTTTASLTSSSSNPPLLQNLADSIQEITSRDPVVRAKIRLKKIDQQIAQLQGLLAHDQSEATIGRMIGLIRQIGQQTSVVGTDPAVQADRDVLTTQIEQYNKLQLILQKAEDQLPLDVYLKIENARVTYLVKGAQASLNATPNFDIVHTIAVKEAGEIVGTDFADLKVIEVLTDLSNGLNPQTQQKVTGLQKQVAVDFEKQMLQLPPDVRSRRLQNYMKLSYGNAINQVRSLNQMQQFLSDRDMILEMESLKELALKKVENRVFEATTPELQQQLTTQVLTDPANLKILIQAQADVAAGKDLSQIKKMDAIVTLAQTSVVETFGKDIHALSTAFPENPNPDLLDVVLANKLSAALNTSDQVSPDVKQTMQAIKQKTLQNFATNLTQKGAITTPKLGFNPVSANADVRVLLPAPHAVLLLGEVKNEFSHQDQPKIAIARRSTATLLATHLLTQVNDPAIFDQYQQFIADNAQVNQLLHQTADKKFFTALAQKKQVIDSQNATDQQAVYEKMQQIVQTLFLANTKTDLEKQLPPQIQAEVDQLKTELPNREVPQLTVPEGVTLPPIAALPKEVTQAIIGVAQNEIHNQTQVHQAQTNLETQAKELGVSVPLILPDNPLYVLKTIERNIALVTKTDPIDKAQELLKQDNEKTLEAEKLIENNPSQTSIDTALTTLNSVASDSDLLKDHAAEVKNVSPTELAKVDALVNQVIDDGLVRQTILSVIENTVHGDNYVAVEKIRADELKDGVDVLLQVTDNNVGKLTQTIEATVASDTTIVTGTSPVTQQIAQLDDMKAVELLNEVARTQPETVQTQLQTAETIIAKNLETQLLALPVEQRRTELVTYAETQTGNPVRQLEAYDILKNNFTHPETILLTETLKDAASQNLQERISEIPDANTQQIFTDTIIGNEPQDLKAVTEIELRVEPPQSTNTITGPTASLPTEVLPIVQKIEDIKANIEQNLIQTYKDNPQLLQNADFFDNPTLAKTPDVVDVQVAQEVQNILARSPEVTPTVIAVAKEEEQKIITTFVDNMSQPELHVTATTEISTSGGKSDRSVTQLAAETLNPAPNTLATLIDLKDQVPPAEQIKIDQAITAQVKIIEDHLVNQVSDPQTFQTYVTQINENPVVAQVVAQTGGTELVQAVDQKAQEIQTTATQDQSTLQTTTAQVEQQIFSAPVSVPSIVEQTLPPVVQEQIQQIKQEVPQAQIPAVTVTSTVTVAPTIAPVQEAHPVQQSTPASTTPAAQPPAPSIPEPAAAPPAPAPAPPAENPAPAAPAQAPAAPVDAPPAPAGL